MFHAAILPFSTYLLATSGAVAAPDEAVADADESASPDAESDSDPTPSEAAREDAITESEDEGETSDEDNLAPNGEDSATATATAVSPTAPPSAAATAVATPNKSAPEPAAEPDKKIGPKKYPFSYGFGAQAFMRGQARVNPDFDGSDGVHNYEVLSRFRLEGNAGIGPVSVFVQLQDARTWGFEASTASNSANTDLHQGYLEVGGKKGHLSGYIRAGRQEANYGTQRMVGALGWLPTGRSFNALRLHGEYKKYGLDIMGAILAMPGSFDVVDDTTDPVTTQTVRTTGSELLVAEVQLKFHQAFNLHPTMYVDVSDARESAPTLDRKVVSPGGWIYGEPVGGLKYNVEGFGQTGENGGRKHAAWAAAADIGYGHKKGPVKPGVKVGYSIASGEACTNAPADNMGCGSAQSTEFFNFYPTNHKFYGLMDLFGWRNSRDLEAQFNIKPAKWFGLAATYHFFQLHEAQGRWSNAGGANVGVGWDPTNTQHTLGHEVDITAKFTPFGGKGLFGSPLMIQPGYGVFIPDGAGRNLAGPDTQHFAYLWIISTFPAVK